MEALRKRTHDLSNQIMSTNADMIELNAKTSHFLNSLDKLQDSVERQSQAIHKLQSHAQILKWLLGVGTVILCGAILRMLSEGHL